MGILFFFWGGGTPCIPYNVPAGTCNKMKLHVFVCLVSHYMVTREMAKSEKHFSWNTIKYSVQLLRPTVCLTHSNPKLVLIDFVLIPDVCLGLPS